MINTSFEWNRYCADMENIDARQFTAKATVTLLDNTVLNITEADIVVGGVKINEATSSSGNFDIGSATINNGSLALNNIEDKFSLYDFDGAQVVLFSGLQLSDTTEWIRRGTYTVADSNVTNSIVIMEIKDNMLKAERLFSEVNATFPITAFSLLQQTCSHCNVLLETASILNGSLVIQRNPSDESTTCREIISWIAQLSGNFAKFNADGKLELKWYDFGVFEASDNINGGTFNTTTTPYSDGDNVDGGDFTFSETTNYDGGTFADMSRYHSIHSLGSDSTATDDVVITGIQVSAKGTTSDYGETSLFGQAGYVLEISDNPLIQEGNAATIANSVGAKIVGMRFRTMTFSAISDTSIEAGDVAYKSDRKGNVYPTLITSLSYTIGSLENFTCDAKPPLKNSSDRMGASTKTLIQARKQAQEQISTYDLVVKQMTDLITNGFGLFTTRVTDENGGIIEYMHDKPIMSESFVRWFRTSEGFIEQNRVGGVWVTVSGEDKYGNALYNTISTRGINSEWINTHNFLAKDNNDNMTFHIDENGKVYIAAEEFSLKGKSIQDSVKAGSVNLLKNTAYNSALPSAFSTRGGYTATVSTEEHTFGDINSIKIVASSSGQFGLKDFSQGVDGQLEVGKNLMFGLYAQSTIPGTGYATIEGANTSTQRVQFIVNDTTWGDRQILDFGTVQNSGTYGDVKVTIWFDHADMFYLACQMLAYGNSLGEWQPAISDVSANATAQAQNVMTQSKVFNALTNNGVLQGLFMKDGQLYINMSYLQSGIIKVGGVNNGNGLFDVYNSAGTKIITIDQNGIKSQTGSSEYVVIDIQYTNVENKTFKTTVSGTSVTSPSFRVVDPNNPTIAASFSGGGIGIQNNGTFVANIDNTGEASFMDLYSYSGANGSFTSADGKTISVVGGIIKSIV